ncbi:MAG: hypothetical protein A2Y15_06730 [Clostridiales bacterium GWF2_36_10]|nr:MAG: hypothetical protein A2Y15_06730 [Clostridiales bacterium GWF2_36_10]HAN21219.1 hypothetical protein [Clostridiales bacterium]
MLKKVITLSIIILFTLIVVLYCTASLLLSDDDINGFSGTFGIIRLTFSSSDNVKLNYNPTQYLIICYKNFEIDNENTFSFIR